MYGARSDSAVGRPNIAVALGLALIINSKNKKNTFERNIYIIFSQTTFVVRFIYIITLNGGNNNNTTIDTFRARWLAVAVVQIRSIRHAFSLHFYFCNFNGSRSTRSTQAKSVVIPHIYTAISTKKETFSGTKTHFGAIENFYYAILLHILQLFLSRLE